MPDGVGCSTRAGEEFFDLGERCIRKHKARHRVSDGMCVECVKVLERLTGGKLNDFTLINRRARDKAASQEKMLEKRAVSRREARVLVAVGEIHWPYSEYANDSVADDEFEDYGGPGFEEDDGAAE